jgi:hypothetical protein
MVRSFKSWLFLWTSIVQVNSLEDGSRTSNRIVLYAFKNTGQWKKSEK